MSLAINWSCESLYNGFELWTSSLPRKTCKQRVSRGWTLWFVSTAWHHWLGWTRPCPPTWVAKINERVFHQRVVPTWDSIYFFDLNGILKTYNHHSSIAAMDYTCWCALGRQGALFCMQHLGPNSYTNNLLSLDHHHRLQGHCKGSNIECADKTLSGMWIHLADLTSIKKRNHSLVFTFISLKSFWIVLNWGLQTHPQQIKMTSKQIRARGLFKLNMAATKSASPWTPSNTAL